MDNYLKLKSIGRGTFGIVHLYKRLSDGKDVVMKEISVDHITDDDKSSANNEVKVLSMFNHPNIVEYYSSFIDGEVLSVVMEYAAGGTLSSFLRSRNGVLLKEEDALNYFCQVLHGLEHIHNNHIVHRDLTTNNIFLTEDRKVVKIGDFGISKILASKSKANSSIGTPCYMSPELCGGQPYNNKSDIWALGCVFYEMLVLKKAFEAPTIPNLVMKIMKGFYSPIDESYSPAVGSLLSSMLQRNPNQRPSVTMIITNPTVLVPFYLLYTELGRI